MRAVTIPEFGSADVLRVATLDAPEPGRGEIAIDVAFAGVNHADIHMRRGAVSVPLPYVPGIEVSGHVRALGEGVEGPAIGAPVAALTIVAGGGCAEVVVTDALLVAELAPDADLAVAAVLPSNSASAIFVLERVARMLAGETVLVHAAAGGVGRQLGQVARMLGAGMVVGAVGSARRVATARAFGYDEVVVRDQLTREVARLTGGAGFDIVVDPIGGDTRRLSFDVLGNGGRLIAMGEVASTDGFTTDELWRHRKSIVGFNLAEISATRPELVGHALRRAVAALVADRLREDVRDRIALERVADAHRLLESGGGHSGRIVLAVGAGGR